MVRQWMPIQQDRSIAWARVFTCCNNFFIINEKITKCLNSDRKQSRAIPNRYATRNWFNHAIDDTLQLVSNTLYVKASGTTSPRSQSNTRISMTAGFVWWRSTANHTLVRPLLTCGTTTKPARTYHNVNHNEKRQVIITITSIYKQLAFFINKPPRGWLAQPIL